MSITDELRKYVNEELDQDYDILEWLIEPDTQEKIDADARSIADEWCDQSCDTSGSKECLHDSLKNLLRRQRELDGVVE